MLITTIHNDLAYHSIRWRAATDCDERQLMRAPVLALSLALTLVLTGCTVAPKAIKRNYTTYNHTIHYNQSQQMLLNLVRLRYRESPMFLKVGAVSTSYTFDVSGGASVGDSFGEINWGLNAGAGYSERPTVTYTPIEGDTFVKQMLAEVNLSSIDRADIRSKDTFSLLKLVFQMQAGDIKSVQPILTLPIATP